MALDFAATYKVLVLGDSNVGKTCIVHRYCDERYYDTYISTIGIDFKQKIINLDGIPIKLQIWDTAGQERFRTLTTAYYRGAMGIILMYDVTSLDSFNHLSYWLRNIEENASPDVVKVLVGNKSDAIPQRAVEADRGRKIAENFEMPFFEVSCKQNVNIEEAFLTLARRIREQRERRVWGVPIKFHGLLQQPPDASAIHPYCGLHSIADRMTVLMLFSCWLILPLVF